MTVQELRAILLHWDNAAEVMITTPNDVSRHYNVMWTEAFSETRHAPDMDGVRPYEQKVLVLVGEARG